MQMDFSHWMALESAMQGEQPRRAFDRATLRRIWDFATPHRRALAVFLLLSVVGALLTVATPVLAGRVVDEIVEGGGEGRVIALALLIAVIAVVDAVVGHRRALAVGPHRRGADPRPAPGRVRARPAHAGRVLHPHPHGGAGQPPQQRRDRRPAGLHLDACRASSAT